MHVYLFRLKDVPSVTVNVTRSSIFVNDRLHARVVVSFRITVNLQVISSKLDVTTIQIKLITN